jgi:uncharacterized phiE125 gp8 family phage protein
MERGQATGLAISMLMSDRDDHYGLVVKTAPTDEPVTRAEAIAFMHLDEQFAQVDLIDSLITAAREVIEIRTRRAFINTAFTMTLDGFNGFGHTILIPRSQLVSIDEIRYLDTANVQQTLSSSEYRADTKSLVGRVSPAYGETWPDTYPVTNAVEIDFTAGYGANPDSVPNAIKTAIKVLVRHWYDNRDPVELGSVQKMPFHVDALIGPFKVR